MMQSSEPVVSLKALSKSFGEFPALRELSLEVFSGEIFALLGPNGAGKTTAMKLLTGMLAPTSGVARIGGFDCFRDRVKTMAITGYQPDEPIFQDHLSGWDLIRFAGDLRGMRPRESRDKGGAIADRLDLTRDLNEYANNYSKGMRKKLAAVLALMHEPRVLILDEPTNGLDPYATRDFHALMREHAARGASVFFSTHLLDQAQRNCHRLGIIHKGNLAAIGTLAELRRETGQHLEDIFFAFTGGNDLEPDTEAGG